MDYVNADAMVSTDWLEAHLDAPDVRIVDASYWLKVQQRDAREEYEEAHIPGAVFFDVDDIADPTSPYPHMMPSAETFAAKVGKLGLGDGTRIVVYDNAGGATAASRVWWMFRYFGHRDVAVLAGGLPKWFREDRPLEEGTATAVPVTFTPRVDHGLLRTKDQVLKTLETGHEQILDARARGRFTGDEEEPHPVPRQGHIPGSINLPFLDLLDARELTPLPADQVVEKLEAAGVDMDKPIVATCGSGITCCMLMLVMYMLGKTDVAGYDGSWYEWSCSTDLPGELGEAAATRSA